MDQFSDKPLNIGMKTTRWQTPPKSPQKMCEEVHSRGDHKSRQSRISVIQLEPGMEGTIITPNQYAGRSIAVFTSGGDAPGMNSAVRAVVRMGIYCGCRVYFIKEGYQGMVDGGDNIIEASWVDVSGIMNIGGTIIGSARCQEFRERPGRLRAAKHLVEKHITNLCVIGGDGSLTGANMFREEWPSLLEELVQKGEISKELSEECNALHIVGLVGSIDNDFCGTDMTIGTDTALHRIIEATDAIVTTAQSHQRCFVLEVMGRHCGYLALVAALACEADYVFLPEHPPEKGWEEKLCAKLNKNRMLGQRVNIIIMAEGAIDQEGKSILSEDIRKLVSDKLGYDTRVTVLGHVQRGGAPSAFDRILGIRMGAEAVLALMEASESPGHPACVISLSGNQTVRVPLLQCVARTRRVAEAMAKGDFTQAALLRGRSFNANLETYIKLSKLAAPDVTKFAGHCKNIGIMNVGAPACGINAAMRSFVRFGISSGYNFLAIKEGFRGLKRGDMSPIEWGHVRGWAGLGGSAIGARRTTIEEVGLDTVAARFREFKLHGLLVIGGFKAFSSVLQLSQARDEYPEFRIPMIVIPATISNNVPGTEFSLGCDTSVNEITQMNDKLKQSAKGSTRRVFVVETMGSYCGYLATMSGLAGGADAAYIFEEPYTLDDLRGDVRHLRAKLQEDQQTGLILRSEHANKNYSSDFIQRLYMEESQGIFDCRLNSFGHVQQGGVPSPFDRNMGTKMGIRAIQWMDTQLQALSEGEIVKETMDAESAVLLGLVKQETKFTPVSELREVADFDHRIPRNQWWMNLRSLMRIMAKYNLTYRGETSVCAPVAKEAFN